MNILFLTLVRITDIEERGIYTDLMRTFRDNGHEVFIVCPMERRYKEKTTYTTHQGNVHILNVKTLNVQKTNLLEKGLATLSIEQQYYRAIKRHIKHVTFDLVLYSTPPITFTKIVKKIKQRDGATSYLLLKDIFPQNAVDIGLMKKDGPIYRFFRKKEQRLYAISDYIGCMSPANVEFLLKHNPLLPPNKVEVNPNSIQPVKLEFSEDEKQRTRNKYGIPLDKNTFIYGGNLGKPQGLAFLLSVMASNSNKEDRFFVVVGTGTEYPMIEAWFKRYAPKNAMLLPGLPKKEYDQLVQSCDVGLIFLDPRFTIPNYPSRLLSYLEYKMPVLMATDKNTDIGRIAEENGYGLWSLNGDLPGFNATLDKLCQDTHLVQEMGERGYRFLWNNYTVDASYNMVMKYLKRN
ncbi:glycosyltransferase family 4 protein [Limibacterium fermenti]|uniref:glycosyltransferase family 4 protein n=1 Tax=Limibacterium fermenti TaxID=3229863 RepID=UPI003A76B75F